MRFNIGEDSSTTIDATADVFGELCAMRTESSAIRREIVNMKNLLSEQLGEMTVAIKDAIEQARVSREKADQFLEEVGAYVTTLRTTREDLIELERRRREQGGGSEP